VPSDRNGLSAGRGCRVLAASTYPGIVAFNLDDLTPQERILQAPTKLAAAAFIQGINQDFVDRHRETFQRAVLSGRCDGVLVSTQINVYADEHPGHNRMYVTSLWKFDKDEAKASRMEAMQALL